VGLAYRKRTVSPTASAFTRMEWCERATGRCARVAAPRRAGANRTEEVLRDEENMELCDERHTVALATTRAALPTLHRQLTPHPPTSTSPQRCRRHAQLVPLP
jgi:hypothetical protein